MGDATQRDRPDWHLRWPFAIALALIVLGATAIRWWLGLAVVGWIVVMYAYGRLRGWLATIKVPHRYRH